MRAGSPCRLTLQLVWQKDRTPGKQWWLARPPHNHPQLPLSDPCPSALNHKQLFWRNGRWSLAGAQCFPVQINNTSRGLFLGAGVELCHSHSLLSPQSRWIASVSCSPWLAGSVLAPVRQPVAALTLLYFMVWTHPVLPDVAMLSTGLIVHTALLRRCFADSSPSCIPFASIFLLPSTITAVLQNPALPLPCHQDLLCLGLRYPRVLLGTYEIRQSMSGFALFPIL